MKCIHANEVGRLGAGAGACLADLTERILYCVSQVHQRFVAEDVVQDYDAGLEFAEAAAILRVVQRGDQRQCLIRFGPPPVFPSPGCWINPHAAEQ